MFYYIMVLLISFTLFLTSRQSDIIAIARTIIPTRDNFWGTAGTSCCNEKKIAIPKKNRIFAVDFRRKSRSVMLTLRMKT